VAAAGGWFAAKRNRSRQGDAFWEYSQRFHNELKLLLSARESSVRFLENFSDGDSDAADTHIALGNLFRRRGEIDRAIAIHESITHKQDLAASVRAQAQYELAKDYDSAGLFDRSEAAFQTLIESGHLPDDAFAGLLQLHERQRDWHRAISVALQYEAATDQSLGQSLSHYYCELSLLEKKSAQPAAADSYLANARDNWSESPRVAILMAESALAKGEYVRAVKLYEKVESLRPELMPEIIDKRFDALRKAGDISLLNQFIHRIQAQRNAYSVIRTTRRVIAELKDEHTADRFFKDQIIKRPSLKGLRDWAHDQLVLSHPDERGKVQVICDLLDQVMEDKPGYRCQSCGYQGNVMYWRCPGCQSWDTVSTIIGVEGE
jgi:lipopolysaccharide biosynthesis regulator YciM